MTVVELIRRARAAQQAHDRRINVQLGLQVETERESAERKYPLSRTDSDWPPSRSVSTQGRP